MAQRADDAVRTDRSWCRHPREWAEDSGACRSGQRPRRPKFRDRIGASGAAHDPRFCPYSRAGRGRAAGVRPVLPPTPRSIQKARAIHDRVITLDTHDDINPDNFTRAKNYTQRLETQVNLPKMVEGGLDAAFFIVYVGQGPLTPEGYDSAYKQAVAKFDAVHHLTKEIAPGQIELALTAADVTRIAKSGKKVALIGIENAYPLGTDIKRVKEFYDRGGRYISLAHNGHSQFADSNTGERDGKWLHNGLSELGKQVIAEAEQVGADDRSLASIEGREHAGARVVEGAGDRLALGGAGARRSFAQHGRRAAAGVEEERRRDSDGGVCELRQDQQAGLARAGGRDCRAAQGVRPAGGRAGRRSRHRRRPGRRRDESPDAGAARAVHRAHGGDRQEHARRSARHRGRLRQSHRLPREEDRPRSRRHLVGLRWRRRRHGLERRRRNLQRDAGAGAARLHRGADRRRSGAATCCA